MKLQQGWVPLGLKLTILLVLCLHLPGVTPRSFQLSEGGTLVRSRRQADDPEPNSSEEEVMEFFEPLVRVLQGIPTPTLPSPAAIWSWLPALRNLLDPKYQTSTPGPTAQPEKPTAGSISAPKTSASPRAAAQELPVSIQPVVPKIPFTAQPPHLELPVSIQPRASELASSVQPAPDELVSSPDEEIC
ncbi:acyl-CoA synthetase short-chain family member 3, mitochondrial [Platysternon megacephalum]|uniref:Acyl-CoA synthetase short-chain family member 3, mitochondrial n=1 Tax=Platysternon megacephalum TaxID=55544 RepID=A0A4D9DKI6_9SAUR|nr:acyl-CoA synthetase short-chain family member 3, mitochondrial [Platysternon megacephalum]